MNKLQEMQKEDFIGLFTAMNGYPCTIRLLDPPLHEFLPNREDPNVGNQRNGDNWNNQQLLDEKIKLLERVEELHEFNPC